MPDRFICDCGYSSEAFAESCPMCGAMMMTIDGEDDELETVGHAEKYSEETEDGDNEEVSAMPQRKAA